MGVITVKLNKQSKDRMKKRTFLIMTVAAGLLCATTFQAVAQAGSGGGVGGGGGGRGGGRGGVLTQDQNTQIRTAVQGSADLTALTTKLAAAQKDAIDAALAPDATEASVRAKVEAVSAIQTDIAVMRYTVAIKPVVPSITADQKTQIDAAPPAAVYGQLFGGGFGGGRGGGGRRGGGGGGGGNGGGAAGN